MSGEKELGAIAHENGINPNMLRGWKREFLDKANTVFETRLRQRRKPDGKRGG